jgi:hypothetical protein
MDEEIGRQSGQMIAKFRNRDCKRAMKAHFGKVLADAISEGWTEREAAFFLAEVADDHILQFCKSK